MPPRAPLLSLTLRLTVSLRPCRHAQLEQKRLRKLQQKLEQSYKLSALFSQSSRAAITVMKYREKRDEQERLRAQDVAQLHGEELERMEAERAAGIRAAAEAGVQSAAEAARAAIAACKEEMRAKAEAGYRAQLAGIDAIDAEAITSADA